MMMLPKFPSKHSSEVAHNFFKLGTEHHNIYNHDMNDLFDEKYEVAKKDKWSDICKIRYSKIIILYLKEGISMGFPFIKKYINNNPNLQFVPINSNEVEQVEKELGIDFPKELKLFLMEIGYGSFVGEDELDENCVLSPAYIRDFRLRQGIFDGYPNYEEENKLIFFIGWESVPFSIELTDGEQSPVYERQQKIASSLEEFLSKITEDPEYFQQD